MTSPKPPQPAELATIRALAGQLSPHTIAARLSTNANRVRRIAAEHGIDLAVTDPSPKARYKPTSSTHKPSAKPSTKGAPPQPHDDPETVDRLRALAADGRTLHTASRLTGISRSQIFRIARRNSITFTKGHDWRHIQNLKEQRRALRRAPKDRWELFLLFGPVRTHPERLPVPTGTPEKW